MNAGPSPVPGEVEITEDRVLSGRVVLRQPAQGYRAAIDPVILAASIPAGAGETALDLGTGVGTAALCLLSRVPEATAVGLELQPALAALARDNARINGLSDHLKVMEGDVASLPTELSSERFDHVFFNPPYLAPGQGRGSPVEMRRVANEEGVVGLDGWISAALGLARSGGAMTLIHRADALPRILATLQAHSRVGEIVVAPLWPAQGQPAKRVLVRARKGSRAPSRIAPGLVLHETSGVFTPAAEAILRGGRALEL